MTFFDDRTRDKLRLAVGHAMEVYANYEANSARLIEVLLSANYRQSMAIYFAVKSGRDRLELYENLILLRMSDQDSQKFMPFWTSFIAYLQTMTNFRNALAHWHPYVSLYENPDADEGDSKYRTRPSLAHPTPNPNSVSIYEEDIAPFVNDCRYASGILTLLYDYFEQKPQLLPDRFQRPIDRRNQAALRPPKNSSAPQSQRPPSVPKLTEDEWLAKYEKEGRAIPE